MAIIKGFTFDGINSKDYGIGITEEGAYSAPQRDIEMVQIPGRNGSYIVDKGTYLNIEVTYHCVIGNDDQEDFNDKVSAFRNEMMSRIGYCRLYDDFHPDEFRLASCVNGIDFVNTPRIAGEFDMVFNCKPQRYLVSGETPVEITSGDKLINQTLCESNPLIIITADDNGAVYVNERPIIFEPDKIGNIELDNTKPTASGGKSSGSWSSSATSTWTEDHYHTGDAISAAGDIQIKFTAAYPGLDDYNYAFGNNINTKRATIDRTNQIVTFVLAIPKNVLKFTAGTSKTVTFTFSTRIQYETDPGSGVIEDTLTFSGSVVYDGNKSITINANGTVPEDSQGVTYSLDVVPTFLVNSSVSAFENEVYFDSETCDAYTYDDQGARISLNTQISVGPYFPVLRPGENGVSYFGGIQTCKIVPRWWKI